jgi:Protein of Unknown function (DUF2784)
MGYRLLASVVLALHAAYLAYVVVGGFLAWRWPRTIWLHLLTGAWGLVLIVFQLNCPLTYAEDWARRQAGEAGLSRGFIDTYIEGVLYPERYAGLMQALAASAVFVSWAGFLLLRSRRQSPTEPTARARPGSLPTSAGQRPGPAQGSHRPGEHGTPSRRA